MVEPELHGTQRVLRHFGEGKLNDHIWQMQLVAAGIPRPKALGSCRLWVRKSIERAWDLLPEVGEASRIESYDPWSDVEV